jgi:hydrogenase/urease accessory protein HupE
MMRKQTVQALASLPLLLVAGNAVAHPGSHGEIHGWDMVVHFLTNPDHVGVIVGGALALAAMVIWSAVRGR